MRIIEWPDRLPHKMLKGTFGFTLIELLTVLAIMALLIGLLLPALSTARGNADTARCGSNFRQISVAWALYCHDSNDHLPPNVDGVLGGFTNWVAGNMAYESDAADKYLLSDPHRSLLGAYLRQPEVYKCPSDESSFVRSVSMNCRMNPVRDESQGPPRWISGLGDDFRIFRRFAQISSPTEIFVLLEEDAMSINDAYFAVDMSNTGNPNGEGSVKPFYMIDFPAAYHNRRGTTVFADGHVELKQWLWPTRINQASHRYYLPPTDPDVQWLQAHCTYRQ